MPIYILSTGGGVQVDDSVDAVFCTLYAESVHIGKEGRGRDVRGR